MVRPSLNILIVLMAFLSANAHAQNWPRLFEIKCKDTKAVAKEAVEYAMLGAWSPMTTKACINEELKYFHPRAGRPEGEVTDLGHITQFVRGRDSYAIKAVRPEGKEFRIDVDFKIDGKTFMTTYEYIPNPEYTATTGICGFVVNPTHDILRSDCIDKQAWNHFKLIIEARNLKSLGF